MGRVVEAIAAGILISIGGCAFLACAGDGMKWLGGMPFPMPDSMCKSKEAAYV